VIQNDHRLPRRSFLTPRNDKDETPLPLHKPLVDYGVAFEELDQQRLDAFP
jgi:hypothetical protein